MSSKDFPSYAALSDTSAQANSKQTFIERFTDWFRNFLENAE
ncbi:hypothetical protein [Tenacibaculum litopenaei]|jgi:hypothetical protein